MLRLEGPSTKTPPPPVQSLPSAIVMPERATLRRTPPLKENTRLRPLPLTVRAPGPGPTMTKLFWILISPEVNATVPVTLNTMVSTDSAVWIVCRSEPGPLSLRLLTVAVREPAQDVADEIRVATPTSNKEISRRKGMGLVESIRMVVSEAATVSRRGALVDAAILLNTVIPL